MLALTVSCSDPCRLLAWGLSPAPRIRYVLSSRVGREDTFIRPSPVLEANRAVKRFRPFECGSVLPVCGRSIHPCRSLQLDPDLTLQHQS